MNNSCLHILGNFGGVAGRMEIVSDEPLIIVDFAHTHDGIEKVLSSIKNRDIVVVFGAGGDRDKTKRPKMGNMVERFAKSGYITNDNPRGENPNDIVNDILSGINNKAKFNIILDRRDAIKMAIKEMNINDVLFVLGKGDEDYQIVGNVQLPFDDRKVIKDILEEE
jgi:UDP-N-acetylmuramoyl-L-alanyl-D-glutamate--2,6-diaminopimelate ligase